MKIFKKKERVWSRFNMVPDAEDSERAYIELPENLRLIYREGLYVGWYTPELLEPLG